MLTHAQGMTPWEAFLISPVSDRKLVSEYERDRRRLQGARPAARTATASSCCSIPRPGRCAATGSRTGCYTCITSVFWRELISQRSRRRTGIEIHRARRSAGASSSTTAWAS